MEPLTVNCAKVSTPNVGPVRRAVEFRGEGITPFRITTPEDDALTEFVEGQQYRLSLEPIAAPAPAEPSADPAPPAA